MAYPRFQKARDFKYARRTSGNITINTTTWANVDTGLDLTLNSVNTNDLIEYKISLLTGNEGYSLLFDVVTVVGGTPINAFGNRTTPSDSHSGWSGFRTYQSAAWESITGSAWYPVQAGDISSGSVTLRLRSRLIVAGSKTILADTNNSIDVFARNLGPVDPN